MGVEENKEKREDLQLEISNILIDEKLFKFSLMKIKYDDFDIKICSKSIQAGNKDDINKTDLKSLLSKNSFIKCSECQKIISSFEFFLKINAKEIIICNDCHSKLIEKETERNYISFDRYISTCEKHEKKYELFCIDCNRNICSGCKENHTLLGQKHEFIVYDNILVEKELKEKANICNKVKSLSQIYKNISIIKLLTLYKLYKYKFIYFLNFKGISKPSSHLSNIKLILMTLVVSHFVISGNENKELHS